MLQEEKYQSPKTVKLFFETLGKAYLQQDGNRMFKILKQLLFTQAYQHLKPDKWNVNYLGINSNDGILGREYYKILELIREMEPAKLNGKWQVVFDLQIKMLVAIEKCLYEIKSNQKLWICKPLRVILRATKTIFFKTLKQPHLASSVSKLRNDLLITLQRYKSARALINEVKAEILPLIDNMQVSILLYFHNYEEIHRILYAPKIYGDHGPKFIDNYLFQKGKYALVNENMREAQESFQKIQIQTRGQKRLVLKYLIPCKLFLGKMFIPKPDDNDESFPEYELLIKALLSADFKEYERVVLKYQKVWIKRGIYLLMDRLRIIIWRNLIKKLYVIIGKRITMEAIQKAVVFVGGEENINECICIVGNLIYEGYLKGYIFQSESNRTLIMKETKAFPPLAKIAK